MDQLPLDGWLTDLGGFARLGADGVDLLMSDSTNAEVPGIVTSERDIAPVLAEIFAGAQQRIIVACFASHVHRVQQVLEVRGRARPQGRLRRPFHGAQHGVARDLGYLHIPSVRGGLMVDMREAEELPPEQIVLISTGSQGEPMSALSRMAAPRPPDPGGRGDTVILASSLIPGNETAVYRVINDLTRLGARVAHRGNALVHVSGHAPAGRAALRAEPGPAAQLHAGARRVAPPAGPRPARGADRRAGRKHRDRRGRRGRRPRWTGRPRSPARSRAATSTWTGCRWAR